MWMLFNPNLLKVVIGSDWLEARGPYDNKIVAMCLDTLVFVRMQHWSLVFRSIGMENLTQKIFSSFFFQISYNLSSSIHEQFACYNNHVSKLFECLIERKNEVSNICGGLLLSTKWFNRWGCMGWYSPF